MSACASLRPCHCCWWAGEANADRRSAARSNLGGARGSVGTARGNLAGSGANLSRPSSPRGPSAPRAPSAARGPSAPRQNISRPNTSRPNSSVPSLGGGSSINRPAVNRPSVTRPNPGQSPRNPGPVGSRPDLSNRPGQGVSRPGQGDSRPGISENRPSLRPDLGSPGANRPGTGGLPDGTTRPNLRPDAGNRPPLGNLPSSRPSADRVNDFLNIQRPERDRPISGDRPSINRPSIDRPGIDRPASIVQHRSPSIDRPGRSPGIDRPVSIVPVSIVPVSIVLVSIVLVSDRPGIDRPGIDRLVSIVPVLIARHRSSWRESSRTRATRRSRPDWGGRPDRPIIGGDRNLNIHNRPSWVNIERNRLVNVRIRWNDTIISRPGDLHRWTQRRPDRVARWRSWGNSIRFRWHLTGNGVFGPIWWATHRPIFCQWHHWHHWNRHSWGFWWSRPMFPGLTSWFVWSGPSDCVARADFL